MKKEMLLSDYDMNPNDILGYIPSTSIDSNEIKERLQTFFSENNIRIESKILGNLLLFIEGVVDDNNHDSIKDFLSYLKETNKFSFIREHTDEIVIFDEDTTEINSI